MWQKAHFTDPFGRDGVADGVAVWLNLQLAPELQRPRAKLWQLGRGRGWSCCVFVEGGTCCAVGACARGNMCCERPGALSFLKFRMHFRDGAICSHDIDSFIPLLWCSDAEVELELIKHWVQSIDKYVD